jgi:hypothetical protein
VKRGLGGLFRVTRGAFARREVVSVMMMTMMGFLFLAQNMNLMGASWTSWTSWTSIRSLTKNESRRATVFKDLLFPYPVKYILSFNYFEYVCCV